jgi:hypothetical protein
MFRWWLVVLGWVVLGCGTRVATVREPVAVSNLAEALPRRWLRARVHADTLDLRARARRQVVFAQPLTIDRPVVLTGADWRFDTAAAVMVPAGGVLRLRGTVFTALKPDRRWRGIRVSDGGQLHATTRNHRSGPSPTVISGARCAIFATATDTLAQHLPMITQHQTRIQDSDTGVWLHRLRGWHHTATVYAAVEPRVERCHVGWAATHCQVPIYVATHTFMACRTGILLRENGLPLNTPGQPSLWLPITVERNQFLPITTDLPVPLFNDGIISTLNRNVDLTIVRNELEALVFGGLNTNNTPILSTGIRVAEGLFLSNNRVVIDRNELRGYHAGIAATGFVVSPLVQALDQTRLRIADNRCTGPVGIWLMGIQNNTNDRSRMLVERNQCAVGLRGETQREGVDVAGILVDQVRGATFRDNNLFGDPDDPAEVLTGNHSGIALRNLNQNLDFSCNSVSTLAQGMVVSGQQGQITLATTVFDGTLGFAGLVLGRRSDRPLLDGGDAASLGTQGSATQPFDNRWLGNRTTVWLPNQTPHMIYSDNFSSGTTFFTRPNPNNNTTYTVLLPENEALNAEPVTFSPAVGGAVPGCRFNPGPRAGFRVGRQRQAAGQLAFAGYAIQNRRLSQRGLLAELMADTVLRDSLPDLQAFYAAHFGGPLGTELRVEQALAEADTALATALNAGLTGATVHEANQKAFNDLYLATLATGRTTLTAAEEAGLTALAEQCPYTGGTAVAQARALRTALYGTPLRYPDFPCNDQRDEQRARLATLGPDSHEIRQETFRCYPNPTDGVLYLDYSLRPGEAAVWELFTLQGQPLLTRELDPEATRAELNLAGTSPGAYIARIRIAGQTLKAFRVILTR